MVFGGNLTLLCKFLIGIFGVRWIRADAAWCRTKHMVFTPAMCCGVTG